MSNAEMGEMEDKAFSSIDFVGQCLLDEEKAIGFRTVLNRVIKSTDNVLDVGTGSGILALMAAAAGAQKVTSLEFDPTIIAIAKKNFEKNGYKDKIEIVTADARTYPFKSQETFDVVIMEMLTAGMVDEFQIQAINNIHERGVVTPKTIFVPARQETYVSLANVDFSINGFVMDMVIHLWKYFSMPRVEHLSKSVLLSSVNFSEKIAERFSNRISIPIQMSGLINAVILSSRAVVGEGVFLENTKSLNPSVAIPIPERIVRIGEELALEIEYTYGYGYQNLTARIV